MNHFMADGRVTKDPEMRISKNGKEWVKFSIASSRERKDSKGEYITDFFNCIANGKIAELIKRLVTKGQAILITGSWQHYRHVDQNGEVRYFYNCEVSSFKLIDYPKSLKKGENGQEPVLKRDYPRGSDEFVPVDDDELPF